MSPEKKAMYALLGAPSGEKRKTAYVVEVSFGGTQWRHVATEALIWDERAALLRVQTLNDGVGDAAMALREITGKPLRALAHSYRVKPVTLAYPKAEPVMTWEDQRARQIEKTKKQIKRALRKNGVLFHDVRFMVGSEGHIDISFIVGARFQEHVAEKALAVVEEIGYTGMVIKVDTGVPEAPFMFEVRLTGPFPLIPGS
jgi:hypothetical protein